MSKDEATGKKALEELLEEGTLDKLVAEGDIRELRRPIYNQYRKEVLDSVLRNNFFGDLIAFVVPLTCIVAGVGNTLIFSITLCIHLLGLKIGLQSCQVAMDRADGWLKGGDYKIFSKPNYPRILTIVIDWVIVGLIALGLFL